LSRLVYNEGEIPKVGEVIAIIDTANSASFPEEELVDQPAGPIYEEISDETFIKQTAQEAENMTPVTPVTTQHELYISPLVRMLAQQRGIASQELREIRGTMEGLPVMISMNI
jgi:2-oxoglutarate dehydrogenase E2 component (dihydrolipoamide succinyltransferase)